MRAARGLAHDPEKASPAEWGTKSHPTLSELGDALRTKSEVLPAGDTVRNTLVVSVVVPLTPLTVIWQETTPCSGASVPIVNTEPCPWLAGPGLPADGPPLQLHKPKIDRTATNTPVALRFPMMNSPSPKR